MIRLTILDVGHANCALIEEPGRVVIIDAGVGGVLAEYLDEQGLTQIELVLVSHADDDHLGGVTTLMLGPQYCVNRIYLNPDHARGTQSWDDFRSSIAVARARCGTQVHTHLTTVSSTELHSADTLLEVLYPEPEIAVSGVGGRDLHGRPLSANGMSAVVRVVYRGEAEVLFTGDLDEIGLENLLSTPKDLRAHTLVFPHHGGRPGSRNGYDFARGLCEAVQPEVVVFSLGRGRHRTPRPEVIEGVRLAAPRAHIACTQLSDRCAAQLPSTSPQHLAAIPARGRSTGTCCAGSIRIELDDGVRTQAPLVGDQSKFVDQFAPSALCLGRNINGPST